MEFLKKQLKKDAKEYTELKKNIRKNIYRSFYNQRNGNFCSGVQGENVLPVFYGVAEGKRKEKLLQNTADYYVKERKFRIDTGIVATPVLIECLTDNGLASLAYKIMTEKSVPSYYDMMKGETTLSECWDKKWPAYCFEDNLAVKNTACSRNHPMFGSLVAWLFKRVAGLDLSCLGKRKIYFKPGFIGILKNASAFKDTLFGMTGIEWNVRDGPRIKLLIPDGLKGELTFVTEEKKWQVLGKTSETVETKNGILSLTFNSGEYEITTIKERK